MSRPAFRIGLLAPRYWLTWLGFGLWWLLAQLPYKIQLFLGAGLGRLMAVFAPRRIAIASRNFELCFPKKSAAEHKALLKDHIKSLGIGFFEIGIAWFWSRWRLEKLVVYEGLEHLEAAQKDGIGVILMGMHFAHLDLGGIFSAIKLVIDASYREHANPVYDLIQRNCRERFNPGNIAIERSDVRMMIKRLRAGRIMWYAPDQDYGTRHSIFVPFFGVPAATITATSQLARLGRARVIPFTCLRKANGGYLYRVLPPLANFPSGDEAQDTQQINHVVEEAVLEAPEQYLWVHRRFKSRPEGEPDLYQEVGIEKGKRG